MRRVLQLGLLVVLAVGGLAAAEIANLNNGFSIRHERCETLGETTRLYLGSEPGSSYVDVATSQIADFEAAPAEPKAANSPMSPKQDLNGIINSARSEERRVGKEGRSRW